MAFAQKTLTFPMGGVSRRAGYREQARPYSAPWAYNVRGTGAVESRRRGGSRPGMVKVLPGTLLAPIAAITDPVAMIPLSSNVDDERVRRLIIIDDAGVLWIGNGATNTLVSINAGFITDDDVQIVTDDDVDIVFEAETDAVAGMERGGKVLLPGTTLQEYDPVTGVVETIAASMGEVPAGCPIIALYRDRVFLAGVNHLWYASRQSDPTDWHFSADMNDVGAAMAGHLALAGGIGEKITALIPVDDSFLIMATQNEIWALQGDPADGRMQRVSSDVGILSPTAWARNPDGVIAFLSKDGVYTMSGAASPTRWSEERIPEELRNINEALFTISMEWDASGRGFHLFLTPLNVESNGLHWWLDLEAKAFWPVSFGDLDHNPLAACRYDSSKVSTVAVIGRDGYVRMFDQDEDEDDGEPILSQVILGPVRLPTDDLKDALLVELAGMMGGGVGSTVTWRVVSASNAEDVADDARSALETLQGGLEVTAYRSGDWGLGRSRVARPRVRGAWTAICLYSESQWAFEAVATKSYTVGRLRHGH